ncbi:hypothetical protein [Planctomycetes bacterium K23_9]|uniref:Glycosyltransferase RgtA/B/C/D-like domain-containing protein n=1 Tax=Stieleria marina TaxID=1930275 RepID=A0A517P206_9BACT|nr:hypothetical protein K239x_54010 [Planctomycetes bacterium K23_9]
MATAALLFAFIGIVTVDVPSNEASFLNANERGLWSTVSVMADGVDATKSDAWQEVAAEPACVESQDSPSPFASMVAASYQVVKKAFRFSLDDQSVVTTRIVLALVNLPLLAVFFAATIFTIDRVGCTKWSRFTAAAATCFATMLLPLSASLNYQLPAAAATAATLWLYMHVSDRLEHSYQPSHRIWVAAGFTATMAAAFQFSAALMLVPWLLLFGRLDHEEIRRFLTGSAIAGAFFVCSWIVYFTLVDQSPVHQAAVHETAVHETAVHETAVHEVTVHRAAVGQAGLGQTSAHPMATDQGQSLSMQEIANVSRAADAEVPATAADLRESLSVVESIFHAIGGHHGLFSLTPLWLLLPIALVAGIRFEPSEFQVLAFAVAVVSLTCLLFCIAALVFGSESRLPQIYPSQLIWMTPLWLLMITPLIEQFEGSRHRRVLVIALLGISVVSALAAFPSASASSWLYRVWPL